MKNAPRQAERRLAPPVDDAPNIRRGFHHLARVILSYQHMLPIDKLFRQLAMCRCGASPG
jgi:CDGSH-type Zn-finger protein